MKHQTVITFGCRLNASESERIQQFLEKAGVDDVLVVNTCAVTAEAERQARQMIRKLRREHPDKKIVVTGCSATVHAEDYEAMSEVDGIVPNADKGTASQFVAFSASFQNVQSLSKATKQKQPSGLRPPVRPTNIHTGFSDFFKTRSLPEAPRYEDKIYDGFLTQTLDDLYSARRFAPLEAGKPKGSPSFLPSPILGGSSDTRIDPLPNATPPTEPNADGANRSDVELALFDGTEERARAFLPIQTGCNNGCTFCLIRIARGPATSFPVSEIEQQALHFAHQGYREIDLTGVDITSYKEGDLTLGRLIQRLLKVLPQEVHVRLSSLDPAALEASFFEALADPRVLPLAHLSLQSGDATVLRRMARRHTPEDLQRVIARLRETRPEIAIGADVIVGFPGETEAMFQNTCRLVDACRISLLHIFPYSDRPGTVANALTPKIPPEDKKRRAAQLRELGQTILRQELHALVGRNVKALVEQEKDGSYLGKTEHFFGIRIRRPEARKLTSSFHNAFWNVPERTVPDSKALTPGHFYSVSVMGIEAAPNGVRLVGNFVRELS